MGQVQFSTIAQDSHHFCYTAEVLYAYFVIHNIKKTCTQTLGLNKTNNFPALSQVLLFSFPATMKECPPVRFIATTLILVKTLTVCPPMAVASFMQMTTQ